MPNRPTKTDARFAPPSEETLRQLLAMLAFLSVAMKPGGGSTDYMKDLESLQSIVSRVLVSLGPKASDGEDGFGLIDAMMDTEDMRRKRTYLTPKGKALLDRILKILERLSPGPTLLTS